jgi:hypothetical protein
VNVYRWAASSGLFFGAISTALIFEEVLRLHFLVHRHAFAAFLVASLTGTAASLIALFLHPSEEETPTLLGHRAVAFIGIGLSSWPWISLVCLLWFLEIGPP